MTTPPTPEQRMIELDDAYRNLEIMYIRLDNKIRSLWKEINRLDEKIDEMKSELQKSHMSHSSNSLVPSGGKEEGECHR